LKIYILSEKAHTRHVITNRQIQGHYFNIFDILPIMNLENQIEAVLFYKAEPIKKSVLTEFFNISDEALQLSLETLSTQLSERGVRIIITDTHVHMVTAPEASELIETLRKAELKTDIGKAGAETLAIILYRGPISRIEVDRIRGVNSTFIIRNLLIRGLVERRNNPKDTRSFHYAVTPTLLAHLGISKREELPDFEAILNTLDTFESQEKEETKNHLS